MLHRNKNLQDLSTFITQLEVHHPEYLICVQPDVTVEHTSNVVKIAEVGSVILWVKQWSKMWEMQWNIHITSDHIAFGVNVQLDDYVMETVVKKME